MVWIVKEGSSSVGTFWSDLLRERLDLLLDLRLDLLPFLTGVLRTKGLDFVCDTEIDSSSCLMGSSLVWLSDGKVSLTALPAGVLS